MNAAMDRRRAEHVLQDTSVALFAVSLPA
jgi:hypothetical protein